MTNKPRIKFRRLPITGIKAKTKIIEINKPYRAINIGSRRGVRRTSAAIGLKVKRKLKPSKPGKGIRLKTPKTRLMIINLCTIKAKKCV